MKPSGLFTWTCSVATALVLISASTLSARQLAYVSEVRPPDDVPAVVESLASFIRDRSGVELSERVKTRLAEMQQRTLNGENRPLSVEEFADVLTDTALERLSALTDEEITRAARTYRKDGDYITITFDGKHGSTQREFVGGLKRYRDKSQRGSKALRRMARKFIEGDSSMGVKSRVRLYSRVLPQEWGRVEEDGLTPMHAVLLTYSIASDDLIHWSLSGFREDLQLGHSENGKKEDPNMESKVAYGVNGYLFPTPVDIILDERMVSSLLTHIEERSKK